MGKLMIHRTVVGMVRTNCYFIYEEEKKEAIIIDPADEAEELIQALSRSGLKPCAILLTHGHFDHIKAVDALRREYAVPVYCHEEEKEIMENADLNLSNLFGYGFTVSPDKTVRDGEQIDLGGFLICVIHTPGHTKGSCCYYFEDEGILISGDTLFAESMGRTDFPTGSSATLIRSIQDKLMVLPEETHVYPGHEEDTTIGYENSFNVLIK